MKSSVNAWRNPPSLSEVVNALNGAANEASQDLKTATEPQPLTIDAVILEINQLRATVRETFFTASPEYQLLTELTESGLRDCAKCLRELEARAAQHPYNKMLIHIDSAFDAARRMTRANSAY